MALAALLAAGLAACDPPGPALNVSEVCESFCECFAPIGPQHDQCVTGCEMQAGATVVPDACITCLDEPLCLEREQCISACLPQAGGAP